MVTAKEKVIDELKTVELRLLNHRDAHVRHQWGVASDAILGERSVWSDIEDEEELRRALESANTLMSGQQAVSAPEPVE